MRPLMFIIFDAVTAARLASVLRYSKLEPPVALIDFTEVTDLDALVCDERRSEIPVVLIDHTAIRDVERRCGQRFTIVFVTPGLPLLSDLLSYIRIKTLRSAQRLAAFSLNTRSREASPQLSMEALYFRPAEIATLLAAATGLEGDCWREAPPMPAPADYRNAVAALLARIGADGAAPMFAANTVYPVVTGEIATILLGHGWSRPESRYTWNEGPRSVLNLLAPPSPDGPMRLRCCGHVVDAGLQITTFVHGTMVSVTDKALDRPRGVIVDVPLSFEATSQEHSVTLEFSFDNTVVPAERGIGGDRRRLAFALSTLEFYTDNQQASSYPEASQFSATGNSALSVDLSSTPCQGSPAPPGGSGMPASALATILKERGYSFCVFLVEEENPTIDGWAEALRMLKVGAAIIAARTHCLIIILEGNHYRSIPSDANILDLVDMFVHSKKGLALLVAWGGGRLPDLLNVWDHLLVTPDAGNPGVAIRTDDFQLFEFINEPRRVYNAVISYYADTIIVEPNGRGWNE